MLLCRVEVSCLFLSSAVVLRFEDNVSVSQTGDESLQAVIDVNTDLMRDWV